MRQLHFHYTSMITPFLIISAIYGFKKIGTYVFNSTKLLRGVVALLVLASISSNIFGGTASYPVGKIDRKALHEVNIWRERLKDPNIRVSASGTVAPFCKERRRFYYFLFDPAYKNTGKTDRDILKQINNYKKADYIIVREFDVASTDPLVNAYYNNLVNDTDFEKISDKHGIEVYRNISRL